MESTAESEEKQSSFSEYLEMSHPLPAEPQVVAISVCPTAHTVFTQSREGLLPNNTGFSSQTAQPLSFSKPVVLEPIQFQPPPVKTELTFYQHSGKDSKSSSMPCLNPPPAHPCPSSYTSPFGCFYQTLHSGVGTRRFGACFMAALTP
ncbi:unnamed protein product [Pleuronectes platessa]|uniref:Uncharacterized protein n=1 Tax=Pleuronectes platessa TaxID=8262 RepID=A0A9N7VHJ3_PLEPL|nr:unnamed protein product [Pleuronectes platessa]